ncbi:MAG: hypothetical protein ACLUSP_11570 [Christensenellales bacterium]
MPFVKFSGDAHIYKGTEERHDFREKDGYSYGEGGAKGTIRSIRRGGELKATYALYGVAGDRFGLIVLSGDERYEYPLGGKSGEIILDSDIDVGRAHFIVSDLSRAVMYGTLSPRRKPAASLPYKLGEKEKKYEAQTDFDEAQTDFEYSTRQTRLTDIFPSPERYADDAIAEVNFIREVSKVRKTSIRIRKIATGL